MYPIAENFPYFLQLFEVIWETTANSGENLTQTCAEKYEGFFCTLTHKFDLITILLVHEILEPNHADHMIGHLAEAKSCNTEKKKKKKNHHTFSNTVTTSTYRAFSGNPSKSSNGIPAYHTPYSYHRSPDTYLHILLYPYCL